MIGNTLTFKNLLAIKQAMDKIKPSDQSDFFKNYYREITERLDVNGKDRDQLSKYQ